MFAIVKLIATLLAAAILFISPSSQLQLQQFDGRSQEEPTKAEPYSFGYKSESIGAVSSHEEQGDGNGRVTGFYTISGDDGRERRVEYVADENGFRANVKTNEVGTRNGQSADASYEVQLPSANQLEAAKVTYEQYKFMEDLHAQHWERAARGHSGLAQQQQQQSATGSRFQQQDNFVSGNGFQRSGGFSSGSTRFDRTSDRRERETGSGASNSTESSKPEVSSSGSSSETQEKKNLSVGGSSRQTRQQPRSWESTGSGRRIAGAKGSVLQRQLEQQFMQQANQLTEQDYPRTQSPQYLAQFNNGQQQQQRQLNRQQVIRNQQQQFDGPLATRPQQWSSGDRWNQRDPYGQQQQRPSIDNSDNNQFVAQQQSNIINEVGNEPLDLPLVNQNEEQQQQFLQQNQQQFRQPQQQQQFVSAFKPLSTSPRPLIKENRPTISGLETINLSEDQEENNSNNEGNTNIDQDQRQQVNVSRFNQNGSNFLVGPVSQAQPLEPQQINPISREQQQVNEGEQQQQQRVPFDNGAELEVQLTTTTSSPISNNLISQQQGSGLVDFTSGQQQQRFVAATRRPLTVTSFGGSSSSNQAIGNSNEASYLQTGDAAGKFNQQQTTTTSAGFSVRPAQQVAYGSDQQQGNNQRVIQTNRPLVSGGSLINRPSAERTTTQRAPLVTDAQLETTTLAPLEEIATTTGPIVINEQLRPGYLSSSQVPTTTTTATTSAAALTPSTSAPYSSAVQQAGAARRPSTGEFRFESPQLSGQQQQLSAQQANGASGFTSGSVKGSSYGKLSTNFNGARQRTTTNWSSLRPIGPEPETSTSGPQQQQPQGWTQGQQKQRGQWTSQLATRRPQEQGAWSNVRGVEYSSNVTSPVIGNEQFATTTGSEGLNNLFRQQQSNSNRQQQRIGANNNNNFVSQPQQTNRQSLAPSSTFGNFTLNNSNSNNYDLGAAKGGAKTSSVRRQFWLNGSRQQQQLVRTGSDGSFSSFGARIAASQ